ncbi:MAG TPA: DUF4476 domain-containing protein, partial [Phnomibacter sp.]|nr:DUF4476 domain-containing protein [Phnomibacter sp.]
PEVAKPAASEAASGPLTPAEIARLQAEARKIDARGKRDSVLRAQKGQPSSTNSQPAFLDIDFTMPADSNVAKAEKPKEVVERAEEIKIAEPEKKMAEDTLVARAVKGEEVKAADPVKEVKAADPVKEVEVKATDPVKEAVVVPVVKGEPEKKDSAEKPAEGTTTATSKNPICLAETTASDLELVTMLMKAEKQADDALEIARKSMRVKCLNTIQVRELAKLFPEEEDRYRLLDMAYRYTTDRQNYAYLSDLLKDPYFVNRFKAMVQ